MEAAGRSVLSGQDRAVAQEIVSVFRTVAPVYDTVIPYFRTFGHHLVDFAELDEGSTVLDLACGRGASLLPAAHRVAPTGTVTGIDVAPEMVEALNADLAAGCANNARARTGDAYALDLPDADFDAVLSGWFLHWMPQPGAIAREMLRVLRPGGRVALAQPADPDPAWEILGDLGAEFRSRATRTLPRLPAHADLAQVLSSVGFEHVEIRRVEERFVFESVHVWWEWIRTHGERAYLDVLPEDAQQELKQAALTRLATAAGSGTVTWNRTALLTRARRPAG